MVVHLWLLACRRQVLVHLHSDGQVADPQTRASTQHCLQSGSSTCCIVHCSSVAQGQGVAKHLAACPYLVLVLAGLGPGLSLCLALPPVLPCLRTLIYVDPQSFLLTTSVDHDTSPHYRPEGMASIADWKTAVA